MLLALNSLPAQIMSVTETDRGNSREILTSEKQIIDINSRLEIKLSKPKILEGIKELLPEYRPQLEMQEHIDAISQLLINQEVILNSLEAGVSSIESQQDFFQLMDVFLTAVQGNANLSERYEALSEDYFLLPNPETVTMENYIFSRFNEEGEKLKATLDEIDAPKYTISLVAYKKDKRGGDRVHVENFDTYIEREYITVERWVTSLSESQRAQLDDLSKKSQTNTLQTRQIFEDIKTKLKTYLPDLTCLAAQKEAVLAVFENPNLSSQISEAIQNDTREFITGLNSAISSIKSINYSIDSWNITTPFSVKGELIQILNSVQILPLRFNSFQQVVGGIELVKNAVDTLSADVSDCLSQLKLYAEIIKKTTTLLKLQQSNYTLNTNLGEEVKSFSLDNLPENGYIDLKGTGNRDNSDELVMEVLLRIPSDRKGLPETKITLEQRQFYMQLIGAKSEVMVGMILANPWNFENQSTTTNREFFYAPTASLLFKFGSKTSYFYNEFVDIGIGLNFASPDFNTDGNPEFGAGIMVTGMKDILSIGINYNVTLNEPYWFFGVNLPFNLPGLPVGIGVKN